VCHLAPLTPRPLNTDREKEREHENLDTVYTEANKNLQQVETTLTNMKAQLKLKKEEVQGPSNYSILTFSEIDPGA